MLDKYVHTRSLLFQKSPGLSRVKKPISRVQPGLGCPVLLSHNQHMTHDTSRAGVWNHPEISIHLHKSIICPLLTTESVTSNYLSSAPSLRQTCISLINSTRYTLLYIDRGVYMGKYTPRAPEGYILKNQPTCKDGGLLLNMAQTSEWNEQVRAICAWRLILSIFTSVVNRE